ncbi:type I-E CRISPR-associated endoribonuclease Cas2e [Pseudoflavonifractor sp. MSJ-37]|uniref:type I-E CRISPR-associated endoribonuclease Cas2e n=1 Tax=Pseudoflavonifractor sp. MSJ-37 TaxID=2841531 RepID=UPI001C101C25|nr:type I-E CRISPR-associated endoribonuclease Cas2e [Pseudoflavonifractor sp. MSJ-37]MBU5434219.1 type I-E CRISPR-associated endoribonuclease Cas2e [Pseudoflavonifractor sp. MSJ-37]
MIVVTVTDCPPRLRGDLSKWLMEIDTGVYVGRMSQRVREELWKRICGELPRGRATMVYPAQNEQRMEFRVHNTIWQPVDFEGLTLMRRPITTRPPEDGQRRPPSKAAVSQMVQGKQAARARKEAREGYVVIDIETTGLDAEQDEILELGAVRVISHKIAESFSALARPVRPIPDEITALTGIGQEMVFKEGRELSEGLERFWKFIGESTVVGHNLSFDLAFLRKASVQTGISMPRVSYCDTLRLARREVRDIPDYRLETLAAYFGIETKGRHRALEDCITTFRVYEKLNEN